MSILIEGMEMPPDGRYTVCITHDSKGGIHWVFQNQDTLEFLKHGAVAEVPEPHGRLIDKDALDIYQRAEAAYAEYQEDEDNLYLEGMANGLCEAAKQLSTARTVIHASKEG